MRALILMVLCLAAVPALADSVQGFCERGGKRLTFSDGIAFVDARDSDGVATTAIYLTAKPLDRKALAACAACKSAPGESTFTSSRGQEIKKQRSATTDGWIELQHVAGEVDMASIVSIMYLASDGMLTGIDGGNGKVVLQTKGPARVVGKVISEAHEAPYNDTDMNCAVSFDLALGWPKS
ncbi:MAG: hypothetical protein ABIW82_17445 [Dokdonella sp.]